MEVKIIIDEDFVNYKKPCMLIGTAFCDWKCCVEMKIDNSICQNSSLVQSKSVHMPIDTLIDRYMNNQISKSIVFGGLEPMLQIDEILEFLQEFRKVCDDDIVIYTGYYDYEIADALKQLKQYPNIIIKFGRFINNQKRHYDDVLGVYLSSDNQYAERIS